MNAWTWGYIVKDTERQANEFEIDLVDKGESVVVSEQENVTIWLIWPHQGRWVGEKGNLEILVPSRMLLI